MQFQKDSVAMMQVNPTYCVTASSRKIVLNLLWQRTAFELGERIWNHCNKQLSEACSLVQSSHGPCYIHQGSRCYKYLVYICVTLRTSRTKYAGQCYLGFLPMKQCFMDAKEGNSSDNSLRQRASIRKCRDQISLSDTPKLSGLMLSLMWKLDDMFLFP